MAFIYWSNSYTEHVRTHARSHAHLRRSNQINTYLSFAFAFIYYYYYYCHYACPIHPYKHAPNDTYSVRQTTEHNTYEAMSHVCVCACDVRACMRTTTKNTIDTMCDNANMLRSTGALPFNRFFSFSLRNVCATVFRICVLCAHTRAHRSGTRRTYAALTLLLSSSNKQTHTLKREQYTDTHTHEWKLWMNRWAAAHGQCKIDVSSCLLLLWLCRLCRLCRSIPVCDEASTLLFTHKKIDWAFACGDWMKPINSIATQLFRWNGFLRFNSRKSVGFEINRMSTT